MVGGGRRGFRLVAQKPAGDLGVLLLHKDTPSQDRPLDAALGIPVRF